ncbi:MAG: tripartite tricarboxylate transporter substrate binding protein [Alphaproteobacteria bacterium]
MKLNKLTIVLGSVACLLTSVAAMAQTYPSKTIRFVVPFPPGNTIDTVARLFADAMSPSLRQTIVIDNQAGASGMVGYSQAARAMPDGYTVIFGGSGLTSAPFIIKNPPVDYHKNFKPVALLAEVPLALIVSAKSSINSVSDLIAQAKQNPGRLSYAAPNTISQFASEQMKMLTSTSLKVVQYKAATQALTDVGNNEVSMFFVGLGTAKPYIDNGTVRAIGWTADTRPSAMPNLPTVAETIPGFYTAAWIGVLVPAGTPDAIVERLNSEFLALQNGVGDKLVAISINPSFIGEGAW